MTRPYDAGRVRCRFKHRYRRRRRQTAGQRETQLVTLIESSARARGVTIEFVHLHAPFSV
jgi:hypothetical protein